MVYYAKKCRVRDCSGKPTAPMDNDLVNLNVSIAARTCSAKPARRPITAGTPKISSLNTVEISLIIIVSQKREKLTKFEKLRKFRGAQIEDDLTQ